MRILGKAYWARSLLMVIGLLLMSPVCAALAGHDPLAKILIPEQEYIDASIEDVAMFLSDASVIFNEHDQDSRVHIVVVKNPRAVGDEARELPTVAFSGQNLSIRTTLDKICMDPRLEYSESNGLVFVTIDGAALTNVLTEVIPDAPEEYTVYSAAIRSLLSYALWGKSPEVFVVDTTKAVPEAALDALRKTEIDETTVATFTHVNKKEEVLRNLFVIGHPVVLLDGKDERRTSVTSVTERPVRAYLTLSQVAMNKAKNQAVTFVSCRSPESWSATDLCLLRKSGRSWVVYRTIRVSYSLS